MGFFNIKMKKKLSLINRYKKEILKGFLRLYYFLEIKYLRFFLFQNKDKKYFKINKISLLCPTKKRSKKFARFAQSLINKTNQFDRIELLIGFDLIEDEIDLYEQTISELKKNGVTVKKYFENLKTHALRNNFLAKNCNGDIIFPVNDDMIITTNNWDKIIDDEFSKNDPLEPLCIWINCDRKYKNLDFSAFPIINASWYKSLNYIVPEYFRFWYLDWWICEVSRISKRYFLSKVSIQQFHAHTFANEIDDTHNLNSTKDNLDHDYNMWLKTKTNRIEDVIKIKSTLKKL
jgi:hypothetical protein